MPAEGSKVVVRAAEGGYPMTATSGTSLYQGTDTSATVSSLHAGRAYGVAAFTYTAQGTLLSRKTATVVPAWIATRTSLKAPTAIKRGKRTTLTASLTIGGHATAGHPVSIWGRAAGATRWAKIASGVTSKYGTFSTTVRPKHSWQYQARHSAEASYSGSTSRTAAVKVKN
jgi:hypothetical protein